MGIVATELGWHPWQYEALDATQLAWLEQVAIWRVERQAKRDQAMLDAIARIMGAKR